MKLFGLFLLGVWLSRICIGAASAAAVWRIWPERRIKFIKYTAIHLHAAIIDGLFAVALIFIASDVQAINWKLNLMWGVAILLQEAVRLPLILYILRPKPDVPIVQKVLK